MNTVCAAGTGSFLDQQATRLNIPIDQFGALALESDNPVRIAGRCTVFAESDMIHKQQLGHRTSDILAGLCSAMVRNYLSNVAKGKDLRSPVFFQGGVAANAGMRRFLADILGLPIRVPRHFDVMGAIGIAQITHETLEMQGLPTRFVGLDVLNSEFTNEGYVCQLCPNQCEIVEIWREGVFLASWGSRCGRQGPGHHEQAT
jgi:activator of 2-hydroxyglutaryl-CoA dehydratase